MKRLNTGLFQNENLYLSVTEYPYATLHKNATFNWFVENEFPY